MPELTFTVRWPDGRVESCYSPSLVVHDHLSVGVDYPVGEFVRLTGRALAEASDRVAARYGFACTAAAASQQRIVARAAAYPADGSVRVLALDPPPEPR